ICSTRLLTPWNCYMTDYVPADSFGIKSAGFGAINNCMNFIHTHHNKFASLTPREKEIAHLIGLGKTRSEIAEILFISKLTLDNHRKHIRQKTGVQTTAELLHFIQIFDAFH
ncbi:MAG: helix-turn-helix transcriptional regulator, partial [Bacteroidales bacterium]|nr:helix-turn-helix transcriptional regulator [Bacteroidales bacterium]